MSKYLNRQAAEQTKETPTVCEQCQALEQEIILLERLLERYVLKAAALELQSQELQKALGVLQGNGAA